MCQNLQNKNCDAIYHSSDPDSAYNSLTDIITDSIHCTIPEKRVVSSTKVHKPWLTQGILLCYTKDPNDTNKEMYSKFRNKLTHIIRKSKREHYTDCLKRSLGDSKKTWQVLNRALGRDRKDSVLPDTGSSSGQDDFANLFNNNFVSIGENLASKISPPLGASFTQ